MKKQKTSENVERYNPSMEFGLTDTQVANRFECGFINNVNKKYSHQKILLLIYPRLMSEN